jgi:ABC-type dipeptide/oligopeptide/nickel transport system ATPase subunit
MKKSSELCPLLPETATFNLQGESGSGKTTIIRAVAGLLGSPDLIAKWDFTRRGLEELAESRNDLPLLLDDIETHIDDSMSLKTALRHVTQAVPKGLSKNISKKAQQADLPILSWSNFGLTTSPPDLEGIARDNNWSRTDGERVRFICIPVPPVRKGGIFDQLSGTDTERTERGKQLISELDKGIAQNFGLILPLWVKFLLAKDRSRQIQRLVGEFVRRVTAYGTGWDERFARKFGVLYATGRLAVKAGILQWPKNWPFRATRRCYRRAVGAIRNEQVLAQQILHTIVDQSASLRSFPKSRSGKQITFTNSTLGLSTTYRHQPVLALRDDTLRTLAGSRRIANEVIRQLRSQKALLSGHGHARTVQLKATIVVGDKKMKKPRFLIIPRKKLKKLRRVSRVG